MKAVWAGLLLVLAAPVLHAQSVTISGLVAHAGAMDVAALSALRQASVSGSFDSMSGKQTHTWTGPLLLDVLNRAGMTDEPGKRTHMRHVVIASGADGYGAAIALGEIDPHGEGKPVIVAINQDGAPLKAPRLVVQGDKSLTRSVHDLTTLNVR